MRRFAIALIGLILAACAAQTPTLTPATPTSPPPATPTRLQGQLPCQYPLVLDSFPQGTLATSKSVDGWSLGQGQLAVNIEGTLVLSSTSRMIDNNVITETMRVSTGRASAENLRQLQVLIASEAFVALGPCYQGSALDAGAFAFNARTPLGLKTSAVSGALMPPPLEEFWSLMNTIAGEAIVPVSTCVYVTQWEASGHRETALKSCE